MNTNHHPFNPDELRAADRTAHALGQLRGAERAAADAELAASPEAQREADELRQLAGQLRQGAAQEPLPPPSPALRDAILSRLQQQEAPAMSSSDPQTNAPKFRAARWLLLATAACLVIAPLAIFGPRMSRRAHEVALAPAASQSSAAEESTGEVSPFQASPAPDALFPTEGQAGQQAYSKWAADQNLSRLGTMGPVHDPAPNAGLAMSADAKTPSPTIGLEAPGVFSADLDVPFARDRFKSPTKEPPTKLHTETFSGTRQRGRPLLSQLGATRHSGPPEFPRDAEQYERPVENGFLAVARQPLSTFSIDVDTASYANVRRFLNEGRWPPTQAVRVEEMINYFRYDYAEPQEGQPFSVNLEAAECPWRPDHRLVRIGLKARSIDPKKRGPSNLVFLLDVSGSMEDANKLPLVKQAMAMLAEQLGEDDRVAIVTYSDRIATPLAATNGTNKQAIRRVIESLQAGGSTNGGAGIQTAYQEARRHFIRGGTNRVILATDGDFNVGITNDNDLVSFIREQAADGIFLTVLAVGTGNLKDAKMEKLADNGNGTYAYLDSLREARRVLVEQMSGTLVTVAKDVKIQVEFNPAAVAAYRLVGYENRMLAARDFRDDRKDAGEIGAGHTVTALYEIVPNRPGARSDETGLKYQRVPEQKLAPAAESGELLTVRLRWKRPEAATSVESDVPLVDMGKRFGLASTDFRFAAAVAMFGMHLAGSTQSGNTTLGGVEEIAAAALGRDPSGDRAEMVDLVRRAAQIGR